MEKVRNSSLWIEEGYRLFAEEGLEGIQVERLSRILRLNKSGFYHYFGDLDGYCDELIRLHEKKVMKFTDEIRLLKTLDPDYLLLLIRYATTVMFQVQLTRNKTGHAFYKSSEEVDRRVDGAVHELWCDFLGASHHSDVAMRYYFIVRDMFYTRITFQNLNYGFLHAFVSEAKSLIEQIKHQTSPSEIS